MGVPIGGGSLGGASGRINIDVSQLQAAQVAVQNAARQMTQAMSALGPGVQNAQRSVNNFSGALRQLSGVTSGLFGVTLGVAGIAQLARFASEVDAIATAYRRQSVAAANLAGSQGQLNDLLRVYDQVTGGALDKATALQSVTQLMAVGFADSAQELEEFATAIRGISVAMGRSQEFVTQNLILELFSQRGARLDQLGLQYDKVRQRADELAASNRNLTSQQAYQQAVLEQATERFGALTRSAEAQATGLEQVRRAWADLRLEIGQAASGPLDAFGKGLALFIDIQTERLRLWMRELDVYIRLLRQFGAIGSVLTSDERRFISASVGRDSSRHGRSGTASATAGPRFDQDQLAAITEWRRGTLEIERQAARDRLDATRQYESQRTETIRQYEQTVAREAQDFALQRARAEEDYAISLQRTHRDIAQREARQLADLERTVADARTDAAERGAERQAELNERIAETRAQSNERIAEMEEEYGERRERSQRDHRDRLLDAAGRLDAIALLKERRDFANRRRDEDEDFKKRIGKERDNEARRLAELNKAHAKQAADEANALQKRIDEANRAYQQQLEDGRAADEQRLTDMSADMLLRRAREDEDRAIRLERMAEDHAAQLAEQARAHLERIVQINQQEAEELLLHNTAFDEQMASLNQFHAGYLQQQNAFQTQSLVAYQQYLDAQEAELARRTATQGPSPQSPRNPLIAPGQFPSLNPSPVVPYTFPQRSPTGQGYTYPGNGGGMTNNIQAIISIGDTGGRSDEYIVNLVEAGVVNALEKIAGGPQ